MRYSKRFSIPGLLVLLTLAGQWEARAQNSQGENDNQLKTIFVIALENHNWTQPANQFTGPIQQIFQNPNAPFINSLVNGTAVATINGRQLNIRAGGLRDELHQCSGHSQRQQSPRPSFRAKLCLGGSGVQFPDRQRR